VKTVDRISLKGSAVATGKARWKVVSAKKLSVRKRLALKATPCLLHSDVPCSFGAVGRCGECPEWEIFEHEMDGEDERLMDEIEEIRKCGYT